MCVFQDSGDVEVGDLVALVGKPIVRLALHAILQGASGRTVDRTHGELRLESRDLSIARERCTETSRSLRTIAITADILRTVPGELDRLADIFGDCNGLRQFVVACATSKAATDISVVDEDLLRLESR